MPRYFFDLRDGERIVMDETGMDFERLEDARLEAVQSLPEIARGFASHDAARVFSIQVRDEAGTPLLVAALSLTIEAA